MHKEQLGKAGGKRHCSNNLDNKKSGYPCSFPVVFGVAYHGVVIPRHALRHHKWAADNRSLQLADGTDAQTETVEYCIDYPGTNEHPAGTDVIGDGSCQSKSHGPETVSSQLINTADTAQSVIWHDFLHHCEPENLIDRQAKVHDHHCQASYFWLEAVRER